MSATRCRIRTAGSCWGRAVSFSDVTLWLDRQGRDWGALGIGNEAVIDELAHARVPQLSMTLMRKAHAVLCGAGRDGLRLRLRLRYGNGGVEQVTPAGAGRCSRCDHHEPGVGLAGLHPGPHRPRSGPERPNGCGEVEY
ncbi:hypothetical protein ACFVFI_36995 [Streptomyces sp. NPDC057705]|uniref:hypothetical protein n=1 Tax=Streptomyces sp. NPDC057705 TaxID=3346222 RepID=UPI003681E56B